MTLSSCHTTSYNIYNLKAEVIYRDMYYCSMALIFNNIMRYI